MIDLKNKIDLFHQMIWQDSKNTSEDALYRSTRENTALITEKREELKTNHQDYVRSRLNRAQEKERETMASLQQQLKQRRLQAQEEFLTEFIKDLEDRFIAFRETEEYRKELKDTIQRKLRGEEVATLYVRAQDRPLVKDFLPEGVELKEMEDRELGGFMYSVHGGRRRIRASFRNIIDSHRYEMGRDLYRILEGAQQNE